MYCTDVIELIIPPSDNVNRFTNYNQLIHKEINDKIKNSEYMPNFVKISKKKIVQINKLVHGDEIGKFKVAKVFFKKAKEINRKKGKRLVCFPKNSLGINIPNRKTILHANAIIHIDNVSVKAKRLTGHNCIEFITNENFKVYDVLLQDEKIGRILVNNILTNTMDPKCSVARNYIKKNKKTLAEYVINCAFNFS